VKRVEQGRRVPVIDVGRAAIARTAPKTDHQNDLFGELK
jgi:hypothetical protein